MVLAKGHRKILSELLISGLVISGCAASRFQSIELAMRQQNWPKAQHDLEEHIRENPRDGEAHLLLAEVYGESNLIPQLQRTLETLRPLSPRYIKPAEFLAKKYWIKNFNLGVRHFQLREFNEAIKRFQFAARMDSANAESWRRLGDALFMTARYYEAKKAYVQALEKEAENLTVKNNLAEIYFIEKQYAKAIELCSDILLVKSRELNALRRRAYCYDALGKLAEAEMDFKLAVELNPTSETLASFGLFYFRQREYRKAIEQFVRAEKTSANPTVLYRYLGEAHWRLRDYKAMAAWYQKLVHSHPDDLLGWKNLALAYEALGQKELLAQARNQINKISSTN